jgi:hypothetical protein
VPTGSKYATGDRAWGLCQKCGLRFLLRTLVFDGYYPNLRVCSGCYDSRQPQEFLVDVTDPTALWKPSPEWGPENPQLSATSASDAVFLSWTECIPRGGSRVAAYLLYRSKSADGVTFTASTMIANLPVVYYTDLADLVENGNPKFDNEGIELEFLSFIDLDTGTRGEYYRYQVFAKLTSGRLANSNVVTIQNFVVEDGPELIGTIGAFLAGTLIQDLFFSSRPYPEDQTEHFGSAGNFTAGTLILALLTYVNGVAEKIGSAGNFTAGTLTSNLQTYTNGIAEKIGSAGNFTAGTMILGLFTYANGLPEAIGSQGAFTAGTLLAALVQYTNGQTEKVGTQGNFTAGTLA